MDNLLSGIIGAILGALAASLISYHIFLQQVKIESNRIFLHDIVQVLRRIYVLSHYGRMISDDDITTLVSFKIIPFEDFDIFSKELDAINLTIPQYNEGVKKSLGDTETSHLELSTKGILEQQIQSLILKIRKLT